ncbi:helix-turn-helix domain-containing protein [Eggerthella sinensis]|uniref:helix-turn-helix domain-containing protein n=1 Tax=Eggerthella sinensis TaxID=242230 RepID=UPI001D090FD5|nr:helix-turn-helix transcriptional regulator [Eggerthella sinensis]MCB7037509.1 helix-turn-helix domain-containing protein [Eggerthella sinensis]
MGYSVEAFSQRLGVKRIAARMSHEGLAAESGIAPELIAQYEQGEATPDLETAYALAVALGCGIDDLAGLPQPGERRMPNRTA